MKKQFQFFMILIIGAAILIISYSKKNNSSNTDDNNLLIQINTNDSLIKINDIKIENFDIENIETIIGSPNRIICDTFNSYYEEFGYDEMPPTSTPYKSQNYYYIYDSLGIIFYTNNDMYESKQPTILSIHFGNKRQFSNTAQLNFTPENSFTGNIEINENLVSDNEKLIPADVNYRTEKFKLYDLYFGPTSITMNIDRLYSIDSSPYIMIYLNKNEEQKISYITISQ